MRFLLSAFICILFTASAHAQSAPIHSSATGSATVEIPSSKAELVLAIEEEGDSAAAVRKAAAEKAQAVVAYLKTQPLLDLRTSSISLEPRYSYDKTTSQQRLTGFVARNQLTATMKPENVAAVLDAVISNGANRIGSLRFTAEEDALAQARLKAIEQAIADARQQITIACSALGDTPSCGTVQAVAIDPADTYQPQPPMYRMQASDSVMEAATPVEAGSTAVTARVTLQFSAAGE